MKKLTRFFLGFSFLISSIQYLFPAPAYAICPVCIVAVGAGLGLSRYLGVDDTVSGIWIGGLLLATSFWFADWLHKKQVRIKAVWIILVTYALVILPLFRSEIIGHPFNVIWGIDKLIFGITLGTVLFFKGMWLDKKVRALKGRRLFNYQKVVFPVSLLALGSLVLYFLTK